MRFTDRRDAGRQLAQRVLSLRLRNPIVLALPRGGVPVGFEVARALSAPLDVLVARKLGAPENPELGIGAIAEGDVIYVRPGLAGTVHATAAYLQQTIARESFELARRVLLYRGGRAMQPLRGRTVVLVDDGLATGVTVHAAIRSARQGQPGAVVLAVPVCAADTAREIRTMVDQVVCVKCPEDLTAVGYWYEDFRQTEDREVLALLARADQPAAAHA